MEQKNRIQKYLESVLDSALNEDQQALVMSVSVNETGGDNTGCTNSATACGGKNTHCVNYSTSCLVANNSDCINPNPLSVDKCS